MGNFIAVLGMCLSAIYLFSKLKYLAKNNFAGIREKKIQNIVDIILIVGIFILSMLHLTEGLKEIQTGISGKSYSKYIMICFIIYFIWMKIHVKQYRKTLNKGN